jgi:hypothetical protein
MLFQMVGSRGTVYLCFDEGIGDFNPLFKLSTSLKENRRKSTTKYWRDAGTAYAKIHRCAIWFDADLAKTQSSWLSRQTSRVVMGMYKSALPLFVSEGRQLIFS